MFTFYLRCVALIRTGNGIRNRSLFLQMQLTKMGNPSMTRRNLFMIPKTKKRHRGIEFRHWTKMGIRKQEYGREKEQSISGRKFLYRLTIGTIIPKLRNGERPGQNIATGIWKRTRRLITEVINARDWIYCQPFMRA